MEGYTYKGKVVYTAKQTEQMIGKPLPHKSWPEIVKKYNLQIGVHYFKPDKGELASIKEDVSGTPLAAFYKGCNSGTTLWTEAGIKLLGGTAKQALTEIKAHQIAKTIAGPYVEQMEKRASDVLKLEDNMVDGRSLHKFLQVGSAYKDWLPRMVEYGFVEGEDFCSFLSESGGGRPEINHRLTLDMAKHLCMIQRTERGKQARQYFIECEKRLKAESSQALPAQTIRNEQAKILLEIADKSKVETYQQVLLAKAANIVTGENLLPMPKCKEQRIRHELGWYCKFLGKKESWRSVLGKKLQDLGVKKIPGERGEFVDTTDPQGHHRQNFEWFEDFLIPKLKELFPGEFRNPREKSD